VQWSQTKKSSSVTFKRQTPDDGMRPTQEL
jgi:hypothetical protein